MARPKKTMGGPSSIQKDKMDEILAKTPKDELAEMPLNCLEDYLAYNKKARALNKKLGMCRYPIKQCPIELHPKQKIIFNRNDQPTNPQLVYLYNEMIDFKETLIPGKEYELPKCVVEYLAEKGVPVWKWFENADGSRETRRSHKNPRFALRSVY